MPCRAVQQTGINPTWSTFWLHRNRQKPTVRCGRCPDLDGPLGQPFPYVRAADAVPLPEAQLGVGYIELGLALTIFAVVSGVTQAPIGYLADHIGARKILLIGLTLGGLALIMLGLHLSYPWLIASAVLLGLANSVYHPADYAILSAHMDERGWAAPFRSIPLPASSAARSRRPRWQRWWQRSAAMAR